MDKEGRSGRAPRRTHAQWSTLLEQYSQSAQTQTAFCAARGLAISSFTSALRRAREGAVEGAPANGFVRVVVDSAEQRTPSSSWDVELTLGAGMVLRIRGM